LAALIRAGNEFGEHRGKLLMNAHDHPSETTMKQQLSSAQPNLLSLLRIVFGLIIFSFGTAKIFHFHAGVFMPPTGSLPWIAGLIELILGFLFLIGFQTRLVAFVLSGEMASAYFIAHFPTSFFPTENGGFAAVVFCFLFLYFVAAGPGPISVDAKTGQE
jgi:putative oxidoreductase